MRNLLIFLVFFLFLFNRNNVIIGGLTGLNIWSKTLFPILFPTFIVSDLLLSSSILNKIINKFGYIFARIFKTSKTALYIFLISMFTGTPTNVKNLRVLYENNSINENDINKIINFTLFFNPFFILQYTSIKILLIIWFANLITGFLFRNRYASIENNNIKINHNFNINTSIEKNINILINILGTITIASIITKCIPFVNPLVNTTISGLMEVTNGFNYNKLYFKNDYLYLLFLSFGGISIIIQIKSILKDISFNLRYFIINRIIVFIVSIIIFNLCRLF